MPELAGLGIDLIFSTTTADYLDWDHMLNIIYRLSKDEKYKM